MSSSRDLAGIAKHLMEARMVRPSYFDSLLQSDKAIAELLRHRHAAIEVELRAIGTFTRNQELINQSSRTLLDSFEKLQLGTRRLESLSQVHASWTNRVLASANQLAHVEDYAKKSLFSSFNLAVTAEQFSARIEFGKRSQSVQEPGNSRFSLGIVIRFAVASLSGVDPLC